MNYNIDNSIEHFTGFKWWKAKRSKYFLRNSILIFGTVFVISIGLFFSGLGNSELKDIVFAVVLLGFFILVGADQAKKWMTSSNLKIDSYALGTVIDMRRNLKPNKKVKNYRITADVNGKEIEGICLLQTYNRVNKGDEILVFYIGAKTYCVHPYM